MRFRLSRRQLTVAFAAFLVLLLALVLLRRAEPIVRVADAGRAAASEIGRVVGGVVGYVFSSKSELISENARLHDDVSALAQDAAEFERLKAQVASLESLLAYESRAPYALVTARVISLSTDIEGQKILIDKGETDGLVFGQAVVSGDGIYVGKVSELRAYSAVIQLVTDRSAKVGVAILNEDQTIGIAEGTGGAFLKVSFIPQATRVDPEDILITSGLDPTVPYGLVIGLVREVIVDEHDSFKEARIEPLMDVRRLQYVSLVREDL